MYRSRLALTLATLAILIQAVTISAQPADDPAFLACQALEDMISQTGDQTIADFADSKLSDEYRDSMSRDELYTLLKEIRKAAVGFGGIGLEPSGENKVRAKFVGDSKKTLVDISIDPASGKITKLELLPVEVTPPIPEINWANFRQRLLDEANTGFAGAVLIARDDSIVLHRGYGFADREKEIPNDINTMFCIGSTPIDFTHVAILKLAELGKLSLNDKITKYIENVPTDKQGITIEHLMTGASGFQNFHDRPVDADPDLSWIDRETAVARMLENELLFEPGKMKRHSHSAWVMLAAIVEIVSRESYGDFLQKHFFDKAGMTSTGLYEMTKSRDAGNIALGYGKSDPGVTNSPQYWGQTSWLVMGSGGMVSTTMDLYRWQRALRDGKLLGAEYLKRYGLNSVGVGGSERGYLCWTIFEGDDSIIMCSNSHVAMDDRTAQIGEALAQMAQGN